MAIDPIGQDSYNGLCVPLYGEHTAVQVNSSNAVRTFMHSADNTGRFLMFMDYSTYYDDQTPSSVITDLVVADIDADGGFRSVSGTSVKMEMNSTGLYGGSTLIIGTSGKLQTERRIPVTTVASGTTGVTVTSADSGTLYLLSSANSTCHIRLTSTPFPGMYIDVFQNSTAAGDVTILTGATGDSQGFVFYVSTGDFQSTAGITNATSGVMFFRVTALTSGSLWSACSLLYSDETTNIYGAVANASTST
jgi:hypothetical protein